MFPSSPPKFRCRTASLSVPLTCTSSYGPAPLIPSRGLGKHYHMRFDPKLGYGTYGICCIPCDCTFFTSILDKPWILVLPEQQQPHYQPVQYCTYWPVLGSFNNSKVLKLYRKATSSEEIDKIHQVVIDGISDNMYALVKTDKYGAINTIDKNTMGYCVIKFVSEPYTLQYKTMFYGKISTSGELVFKAQYINYMQNNMKCYWGQ